jgi:hypothetical protein
MEWIEHDLQEIASIAPYASPIQLLSANPLAMTYDKLAPILEMINKYLPKMEYMFTIKHKFGKNAALKVMNFTRGQQRRSITGRLAGIRLETEKISIAVYGEFPKTRRFRCLW